MKTPHRSNSFAALALVATALLASPAAADDRTVKIPVPPAPRIVLPAPPPMIWLPAPQVYVAHDSPHHIFFHGGRYYLHHRDIWYLGSAYNGPWTVVQVTQVPPGLRKYRGDRWGHYQREATQRFREGRDDGHPPFYAGRPKERAKWKEDRHDRGWHGEKEKKEKKERRGGGRDKD